MNGRTMHRDPEEVLRAPTELLPWHKVAASVPADFVLRVDGLFRVQTNQERRVSGPIWVDAMTRDGTQKTWGILIHWLDRDGKEHEGAFPVALLHENRGSSLVQALAASGLLIQPQAAGLLVDYLAAFDSPVRVQSVARLGCRACQFENLALPGYRQVVGAVNQFLALSRPALVSALSKKSFSKVS